MAEQTRKHRRGDRKDAWLVRDLDGMHQIMPYMMPNRTDNEAVMTQTIDLTALNAWLAEKNAGETTFKYTLFHAMLGAIAKTVVERPLLNRFIAHGRFYDRKELSFSFVVKKKIEDNATEAMCILRVDPDDERPIIEQVHTKVRDFVFGVRRQEQKDGTNSVIDFIVSMPRPITAAIMATLRFLEKTRQNAGRCSARRPLCQHGLYLQPRQRPYERTISSSNNWGSNSVFVIIGEKHFQRFELDDGSFEKREVVDLSITVDERIADGIYFSNSVQLLKHLLENPVLLDAPLREKE